MAVNGFSIGDFLKCRPQCVRNILFSKIRSSMADEGMLRALAGLLFELLCLRDGIFECEQLQRNEINSYILFLCTA